MHLTKLLPPPARTQLMTFPQGASDMPAWVVAKANQYARDHALTPFVIYQGLWNVMDRSFEREIIPMAREEGMALAPWNVLAGGKLRTDAEEAKRAESGENGRSVWGLDWRRNEQEKKMSAALEKVAKEVGAKNVTSGGFLIGLEMSITY
jgi:aryl-alcohol dehydrogenase-like predicted oxidoreductase